MSRVTIRVEAEISGAYRPKEAAKLLDMGIATLWRRIRDEKMVAVRIGGRTFIPKQEVERIKSQNLIEPG